jgi:hypothetical protein
MGEGRTESTGGQTRAKQREHRTNEEPVSRMQAPCLLCPSLYCCAAFLAWLRLAEACTRRTVPQGVCVWTWKLRKLMASARSPMAQSLVSCPLFRPVRTRSKQCSVGRTEDRTDGRLDRAAGSPTHSSHEHRAQGNKGKGEGRVGAVHA